MLYTISAKIMQPIKTQLVLPFLHSSQQSVFGHAQAYPFPEKLPLRLGQYGPKCNTWSLGPTWVHNPSSVSVSSAIFAGLHSTASSGMLRHVLFPKNCTFALGNLDPHPIHKSLCPPESKSQMASGSVQLFLHGSRQKASIFYNGRPFPPKISPSHGDLNPM